MFDPVAKRSRLFILQKRILIVIVSLYTVIALCSGYRAFYQVHSLVLTPANSQLRPGVAIATDLISYGRTSIEVKVELIQGQHAETISVENVPGNYLGFFDQRPIWKSHTASLSAQVLEHYNSGAALLRATATGRPQWTRLPPPVVREVPVLIP